MKFININVIAINKNYLIGSDDEDTLYKINRESIVSEVNLNQSYNFYLDENELEVFYKDDRYFKILLELEDKNEVLTIKKDKSDNYFLSTQIGTSLLVEQFSKKDFESLDLEGNDLSIFISIKNIMRVKKLQERD